MHQLGRPANAQEEFYRTAVCEKIACAAGRREAGADPPVSTLRWLNILMLRNLFKTPLITENIEIANNT